eukprot:TRINITY_DN51684_c0_g1_i1.p2 TRINITY_DN51684_c0_g1~~TRINITY_DN51684_c0_g1_i1.p2  ORF type:complete len:150 (+),score=29.07 TRINITY_DN51684_c0_g1_i1:101-550(+)
MDQSANNTNFQSQFRCSGCTTVLAFPVGAPSVRCPVCQTVTPIGSIRVACSSCSSALVVPQNTTVCMCPFCSNVMSVARPVAGQQQTPAPMPQGMLPPMQAAGGLQPMQQQQGGAEGGRRGRGKRGGGGGGTAAAGAAAPGQPAAPGAS